MGAASAGTRSASAHTSSRIPGDSLTRVCDLLGVTLEHTERSDSMPFWDATGWKPIQEYYGGARQAGPQALHRGARRRRTYEELEHWDHASLREWMRQYTTDEGVFLVWEAISVLEQITAQPWEHSASENLYVRKLHYDTQAHRRLLVLADGRLGGALERDGRAFRGLGGELLPAARPSERVVVEDGEVRGRRSSATARSSVLEAREVVVSAPVWNLPRLFDDGVLPWDLLARIQLLRTTATAPAGSATGSRPRSR